MNTSTLRPPSKCPIYAIALIISGYTVMMASAFVSTIPLTKLQAPNKMQIIRPRLILPKDLLYHRNVGIHNSQPDVLFSSAALLMTTSQMNLHANVAVRLDTPLLAPEQFQPTPIVLWRAFLLLITSDAFKTASFAFFVAFALTLAVKKSLTGKPSKLSPLSKASSSIVRIIAQSITNQLNTVRGRISRTMEEWSIRRERKLQSGESPMKSATGTVPMKFNVSDPITQGWGVCTLLSKKKMGRSRYMQYEFSLPQANNTLALALGQQIALSCLDSGKNVVRGDFYLASPRNGKGKFSILLPDSPPVPDMSKASGGSYAGKLDSQALANLEYELGKDSGNFARVLKTEINIGDELALKPAQQTLQYRGQYLPVTDILYFASGAGIVPVVDQVRAVLPSGSSSVKGVSVVWINKNEKDFDVALSTLESEYFKYNTKLAVSCIIDDSRLNELRTNRDVEDAVPNFRPGTMAVISGPRDFCEKAKDYLTGRGYQEECICVL